jgi:hypothetical protein
MFGHAGCCWCSQGSSVLLVSLWCRCCGVSQGMRTQALHVQGQSSAGDGCAPALVVLPGTHPASWCICLTGPPTLMHVSQPANIWLWLQGCWDSRSSSHAVPTALLVCGRRCVWCLYEWLMWCCCALTRSGSVTILGIFVSWIWCFGPAVLGFVCAACCARSCTLHIRVHPSCVIAWFLFEVFPALAVPLEAACSYTIHLLSLVVHAAYR